MDFLLMTRIPSKNDVLQSGEIEQKRREEEKSRPLLSDHLEKIKTNPI